jgi:hypothetical protein
VWIRRVAADDADREGLRDVFGDRQQLRHRLERPAEVVLIQPGHNDALATIRQGVARGREVLIEKLTLVDPDDLVSSATSFTSSSEFDVLRGDPHVAVRDDVILAEPVVDERLEDLDLLAAIWVRRSRRISSSLLPLNMLPDDHFYPAVDGALSARCPWDSYCSSPYP